MTDFHTLRIAFIKVETADTKSIGLEIPNELRDTFKFKAGQYLTVGANINGEDVRRSYSMSSGPSEDKLVFTVKVVPNGKMSTWLNHKVKEGDSLQIMKPEGRFTPKLDADTSRSYYLFAAGSGITPIMSIIKAVLEDEPLSTVHLLYASRNEESVIFKDNLEAIQKKYQDQLIIDYILSQPKKQKSSGLGGWFKKSSISWTGKKGRIDISIVNQFFDENPMRGKNMEIFICGPAGFIETVNKACIGRGIDKKQVHIEYFTSEDTATKTPSSPITDIAKVSYTLDGTTGQIEVAAGDTILDGLLKAKVNAPFSCQSGACSTCMAKTTKGAVHMDSCLALDEDEIEDGYILTCQSKPTTAEVELSFDV